jgi:hypothetical protein
MKLSTLIVIVPIAVLAALFAVANRQEVVVTLDLFGKLRGITPEYHPLSRMLREKPLVPLAETVADASVRLSPGVPPVETDPRRPRSAAGG